MFKDECVVITGGSSGIGERLAHDLARKGAKLALIARDPDKLSRVRNQVIKESGASSHQIEVFSCDVSDPARVEKTMASISGKLGAPRCLINSAGVLSGGYFEDLPDDDFRLLMEINFFGTLNCIRAALPYFKKRKSGRVVNVSSIAGVVGVFGYASYCSSKHALVGLTETLRQELKPQGIKVQLVLPPETDTPMLRNMNKKRPIENKAVASSMKPISAGKASKAIIKGIERDLPVIVPGASTRFYIVTNKMVPPLGRAFVDFLIKRYYRGPDK